MTTIKKIVVMAISFNSILLAAKDVLQYNKLKTSFYRK